jgi:hypothetical protein
LLRMGEERHWCISSLASVYCPFSSSFEDCKSAQYTRERFEPPRVSKKGLHESNSDKRQKAWRVSKTCQNTLAGPLLFRAHLYGQSRALPTHRAVGVVFAD